MNDLIIYRCAVGKCKFETWDRKKMREHIRFDHRMRKDISERYVRVKAARTQASPTSEKKR